jgi:hypothetical protein
MAYLLKTPDPELWAYVKAAAYLRQLTINDYIMLILGEAKAAAEEIKSIAQKADRDQHTPQNL